MSKMNLSIDIDASPEAVFDMIADIECCKSEKVMT